LGRKKLVVHLSGGLGNQLFQFMAGYALANKVGKILEINTNWYENPSYRHRNNDVYGSKRKLDIMQFETVASLQRDTIRTPRDGRFERWLSSFAETQKAAIGICSEESFRESAWINPRRIRRLVGYFMSPKYFLMTTTEGLFTQLVEPLSPWELENSEKIKSIPTIGVHVRLGDYLRLGDTLIPSESYYISGVDYLRTRHKVTPKVYLFTDSVEQLWAMFPSLCEIGEVISPPQDATSVGNLILLASCSSFVCSNSTFSWWGAELSGVSKDLIVRPSYSYVSKPDLDLMSDLWHPSSPKLHPISGQVAPD
jgi:hypothetical protein